MKAAGTAALSFAGAPSERRAGADICVNVPPGIPQVKTPHETPWPAAPALPMQRLPAFTPIRGQGGTGIRGTNYGAAEWCGMDVGVLWSSACEKAVLRTGVMSIHVHRTRWLAVIFPSGAAPLGYLPFRIDHPEVPLPNSQWQCLGTTQGMLGFHNRSNSFCLWAGMTSH